MVFDLEKKSGILVSPNSDARATPLVLATVGFISSKIWPEGLPEGVQGTLLCINNSTVQPLSPVGITNDAQDGTRDFEILVATNMDGFNPSDYEKLIRGLFDALYIELMERKYILDGRLTFDADGLEYLDGVVVSEIETEKLPWVKEALSQMAVYILDFYDQCDEALKCNSFAPQ